MGQASIKQIRPGDLYLLSRTGVNQKLEGSVAPVCLWKTGCRRDAAHEPTWMYLRRVLNKQTGATDPIPRQRIA